MEPRVRSQAETGLEEGHIVKQWSYKHLKSTALGYHNSEPLLLIMRCVTPSKSFHQLNTFQGLPIAYRIKISTPFLAYNTFTSMLPSYIFILISFHSLFLWSDQFSGLTKLVLFPHRLMPFNSPNLFNALYPAWMPLLPLVCLLFCSKNSLPWIFPQLSLWNEYSFLCAMEFFPLLQRVWW